MIDKFQVIEIVQIIKVKGQTLLTKTRLSHARILIFFTNSFNLLYP